MVASLNGTTDNVAGQPFLTTLPDNAPISTEFRFAAAHQLHLRILCSAARQ